MKMTDYLTKAATDGASDLFIVAGSAAGYRIRGRLVREAEEKLMPGDTDRLIGELYELAGRSIEGYKTRGDDDFSFALPGTARFRVSTYRQRGSSAAVIRVVAFRVPDYKELSIPEEVMSLADVKSGFIIITGTAGSGKSTTQACIIDRINHTRDCHIITLEDPIEFLHRNDKSIISQREIAIDTADCLSGLRASLRQAPDVMLLGEMRDSETIRTAMTAAETGHTVIATLHTRGAVNAVDRIIDAFPASQQSQIRIQLSSVLHTVVSQHLMPGVDGALVPAFEIMHTSSAIRNLIREGKTHQLPSAMTTAQDGTVTMDQAIYALYTSGKINREAALHHADFPDQLERRMK